MMEHGVADHDTCDVLTCDVKRELTGLAHGVGTLREDRDYFKAAYARKLDDERKALEVGLAVLEGHERFKRTVAFGEREYLKAHGGSYGVCKYKSALEQAMGVEKRLHEKSRGAMSGFEREHAYCVDVLRMILGGDKE